MNAPIGRKSQPFWYPRLGMNEEQVSALYVSAVDWSTALRQSVLRRSAWPLKFLDLLLEGSEVLQSLVQARQVPCIFTSHKARCRLDTALHPAAALAFSFASSTIARAVSSASMAVLSTTTASAARTSGDISRSLSRSIALVHFLENFLKLHGLALFLQFALAASCAHFGRSIEKNF